MKSPKTIISLLAIMLITTMVAFISSANKTRLCRETSTA